MGERKGVNKYYPPDFDPSKGSLNSWLGTHPLRDRARKLHKGILVIRFEMPYNIWCGGCNNHIGMGVRYNAEKSKVGNYYTTPIYKFRMKCHLCDNYFEIQTDPKNHDYVILEGARRKEQRWDPRENEQIVPEDKTTQKKLATDPMYKLEHGSDDVQRGKSKQLSVAQIEDMRDAWNDDYILNKMARNKFREEKKQLAAKEAVDKALLDKASLQIKLVPEDERDKKLASLLKYTATKSFEEKQQEKRKEIERRPLFTSPAATLTPSSTSSLSHRAQIKHKLGLHLTSPRAEHVLKGVNVKKLVNVHKSVKSSTETRNSGSVRESQRDKETGNTHSAEGGDMAVNNSEMSVCSETVNTDNNNEMSVCSETANTDNNNEMSVCSETVNTDNNNEMSVCSETVNTDNNNEMSVCIETVNTDNNSEMSVCIETVNTGNNSEMSSHTQSMSVCNETVDTDNSDMSSHTQNTSVCRETIETDNTKVAVSSSTLSTLLSPAASLNKATVSTQQTTELLALQSPHLNVSSTSCNTNSVESDTTGLAALMASYAESDCDSSDDAVS